MVQIETIFNIVDNSGAKRVKALKIYRGTHKKVVARVGDFLLVSLKKYSRKKIPEKSNTLVVLITRRRNNFRLNGHSLKVFKNNGVIVRNKEEFKFSTVKGPLLLEIKKHNITDIAMIGEKLI